MEENGASVLAKWSACSPSFRRSDFKSRWSLQFLFSKSFEKYEITEKEAGRIWPIFKINGRNNYKAIPVHSSRFRRKFQRTSGRRRLHPRRSRQGRHSDFERLILEKIFPQRDCW